GDLTGGWPVENAETGEWDWSMAQAMTQDAENSAVWTLTLEGVEVEAKKYEYKAAADNSWDGYQLPAEGNADFVFGTDEYPAGKYNLTFTVDTEKNELTLDVQSANAQDIDITVAEGDIAAALNAAKEGVAKVGDITIRLNKDAAYTIGATLTAPNNFFLYGNDATVTVAEEMEDNFITLDGTEVFAMKDAETASDHKLIKNVEVRGVTIKGLKAALVRDNQKTLVENLVIDYANIEMPAAGKNVLDFNGKGYIGKAVVTNSTIWAADKNTGFFAQYGSRPKNINGDWLQEFVFENNTIVNIANGKNFNNFNQKGTAQNVYTVKNNIFVDCGKANQVVVGMNAGQTSATPVWAVDGNYFEWGGACVNDAEIEKAGKQNEEDIVKNCVEGTLTFTAATAGDFNGEFALAEGATAPESLGAPIWNITFKPYVAPAFYAVVGGNKVPEGEEGNASIFSARWDAAKTTDFMTLDEETGKYVWKKEGVELEAQTIEMKVIKKAAEDAEEALEWYPTNNVEIEIAEAGEYNITVTFDPNAEDLWAQSTVTAVAEPIVEPAVDYYLVGNFNEWAINDDYKLTLNTEAVGVEEYMITDVELAEGAEFKVKSSTDAWYPDGEGNNYVVGEAGKYTIYFRPNADGGEGWHYNVIYAENLTVGINLVKADDLKNAEIFNLNGQRVQNAQKGLYIVNGRKVVIK
ncbi:MAG: DUF4957 domain-containing protein, partial [Prevotella sp.]|nr:DUF4957 domain-containing protein [Prevotella sp.]